MPKAPAASAASTHDDPSAAALYAAARERLGAVVAVLPHTDADGLASGAAALRFLGWTADRATLLPRGANPYAPDLDLPGGETDAVAVLDQGVRPFDRRPSVFVDHHAPELPGGVPSKDQLVVSGYGEPPGVSTSVMVRRVLPDTPAWLAAVGAAGDYGDAAFDRPECDGVARARLKTAVKTLAALVNAPRRTPSLDGVRVALAILVDADGPKQALADPRVAVLEAAKQEYRAAFDAAMKSAPKVGERVAVIRISSPYQVHPLVAQTWLRRLAPKPVLAANDGYLRGRVNFALRGGTEGDDLRQLLKDALPGGPTDGTAEFAHGHDRATGGSLSPEDFEALVAGL